MLKTKWFNMLSERVGRVFSATTHKDVEVAAFFGRHLEVDW